MHTLHDVYVVGGLRSSWSCSSWSHAHMHKHTHTRTHSELYSSGAGARAAYQAAPALQPQMQPQMQPQRPAHGGSQMELASAPSLGPGAAASGAAASSS